MKPTYRPYYLTTIAMVVVLVFAVGCARQQLTRKYDISKSELGTQDSVGKLTSALNDSNPSVRGKAAKYLYELGPDASEALPKMIQLAEKDPDISVRIYAVKAISAIHPNRYEAKQYLADFSNNCTNQKLKAETEYAIRLVDRAASSYGIAVIRDNTGVSLASVDLIPTFKYYNGYNKQKIQTVPIYGVLPIYFVVRNLSSSDLLVDPAKIRLVTDDSTSWQEKPIEAEALDGLMEKSINKEVAKVVLSPWLAGNPSEAARANVEMATHRREVLFEGKAIPQAAEQKGYLFFNVPKQMTSLAGYKMIIIAARNSGEDVYELTYAFDGTFKTVKRAVYK